MLGFCKAMVQSSCGTAFSKAAVQTSCGTVCRLRAVWTPIVPGTPQCAARCSVYPSSMAAWAQRSSVGWPRMLLQPAQPLFRWTGPCMQSPSCVPPPCPLQLRPHLCLVGTVQSPCSVSCASSHCVSLVHAYTLYLHPPYHPQSSCSPTCPGLQISSRLVVKRHGVLDGQLFMIKQLLILREQIAPFEADFAVTEYDLDFSHMRDHLRRIMAGKLHGRCGPQ